MTQFAAGKNAHGFCDVCGFRCQLAAMKMQTTSGKPTGIMACPTCYDGEHPQDDVGRYRVQDPQALRTPRPDPALAASRGES